MYCQPGPSLQYPCEHSGHVVASGLPHQTLEQSEIATELLHVTEPQTQGEKSLLCLFPLKRKSGQGLKFLGGIKVKLPAGPWFLYKG